MDKIAEEAYRQFVAAHREAWWDKRPHTGVLYTMGNSLIPGYVEMLRWYW